MKQQVANYTVIIEKQKRLGTNEACYTAFVPILDIATEADTIEQVEKDINALITFHLESLEEEGAEIPFETEHTFVTRSTGNLPTGLRFAI